MNSEELKKSFTLATQDRNTTIREALELISNAAANFKNDCKESGNTLSIVLKEEQRQWKADREFLLRQQLKAVRTYQEDMMAERAREGAEISVMRRRLMKSGLIWALSTSTAAVLTTLLFLSALPYTALPIAIQARVEQFAAATARLNELNSQTEDAQRKLDRLSATQWDMEALSYVKPLLGQIKESPRAIYLKVPSKLESMPGPDDNTTWIRIR